MRQDNGDGKDDADEAFGEDVERAGGSESPTEERVGTGL